MPRLKFNVAAVDPPIFTVTPLSDVTLSVPSSVTVPESIVRPPRPPAIVAAAVMLRSAAPCLTSVPPPEIDPVNCREWSVPRLKVLVPDRVRGAEMVSWRVAPEMAVVVIVAPLISVRMFDDVLLRTVNADV